MQAPDDLIKRLMEELQVKEFEKKMEEFREKLKQAGGDLDKLSKIVKEIRIFYEGVISTETNPLWRTIGELLVALFWLMEAIIPLGVRINQLETRISQLEKRIEKLEKDFYPPD